MSISSFDTLPTMFINHIRRSPVRDPFAWAPGIGSNEAVKFFSYRSFLPPDIVEKVLFSASYDSSNHRGELPITEPLQFHDDNVVLTMRPKRNMNWWAWANALWGIRMSIEDHQMYFEFNFSVISRRYGEIGYGTLSWAATPIAATS